MASERLTPAKSASAARARPAETALRERGMEAGRRRTARERVSAWSVQSCETTKTGGVCCRHRGARFSESEDLEIGELDVRCHFFIRRRAVLILLLLLLLLLLVVVVIVIDAVVVVVVAAAAACLLLPVRGRLAPV